MTADQIAETAESYRYSRLTAMSRDDVQAIVRRGPHEAAGLAEAAAKLGIVDAQLTWAQMLLRGLGTQQDPEAAFRWFTIAAGTKRPDTLNMLGRCHELGWGTAINYAEAARLYREAAAQGYDWALFNLATLLFAGAGVEQSFREALALYVRAARKGHGKAMTVVGRFREEGWAASKKPTAALRWYARGAARGDCRADYRLAQLKLLAGEREAGLFHLEKAVDGAFPEFCRSIAPVLLADKDEDVRSLGRRAAKRASEIGHVSDLQNHEEQLSQKVQPPEIGHEISQAAPSESPRLSVPDTSILRRLSRVLFPIRD